jgi:aspartate/methionine/tyrosine aminotransferase
VAAGFKVTVEQLEAARTPATKALVFVSPSNPTGVVYTRAETEAIGRWALEHGIWVITDEIYEHLVFGDHVFTSMPVVVPELAEQCIIVNGVAKTYAMTGWRVGWIVAPGPLAAAATNLQSHQTSNVCNVAQRAALAALEGGLGDVERMREAFERRGRRMHEMLAAIDGVTCLEPQGAFYCFPDVRAHLGRTIAGRSVTTTAELADVALDEAKVAVVPGEAFDAPGYLRLSFALGDDDIVEGVSRLGALLSGS